MCIEAEMEKVQTEIKLLTNRQLYDPLPMVSTGPNLSRRSGDMWKIYQYRLDKYQELQNLPSEIEFLKRTVIMDEHNQTIALKERLAQLELKGNMDKPLLEQPTTVSQPISYKEKVERAKLIAQHLLRGEESPRNEALNDLEQIIILQKRLMTLEETYMKNME